MNHILVDFETFYRKGKTATPSVQSQGNWLYTHDPEFEALLISVCDGVESWAGPLDEFNWAALEGRTLVAHNAGFDRAVYRRLLEDRVAPPGLEASWHCSADMSAYVLGARNLKEAMLRGFGMTLSKQVRDDMSGLRLADMKSRGILAAATEYARGDALNGWNLWEKYSKQWPDKERRVSDLTIEQRTRGVRIDLDAMKAGIIACQEGLSACERNMPWMARGAKPTSAAARNEECRRVGIPCPPTKEEDEEGYLKWEAAHVVEHPWVALAGYHRSISKVLSGLEFLAERIRPDGRFEFELLYFGGHTGRWSSRGYNMQNMRKTPLVIDAERGLVVPWPEHKRNPDTRGVRRVIDMRGMFIPAEGHVFIDCDLSQIEPRVLQFIAGNHEALAAMREGMSVYEIHARAAKRWTGPGDLKSGNPSLYSASKMQVLQLGYQSGWEKFQSQAFAEFDITMTDDEAKAAVEEYRTANPKVVQLWKNLDKCLRDSAGEDFEYVLPSGRSMKWRSVRRVLKSIVRDKATKEVERRWETTVSVDGHFGRESTYGGKITENVVQATGRDVFVEGELRVEEAGIKTLWPVHDQIIAEVPADRAEEAREATERAMAYTPDWLAGCPVAAESVVCTRYTK